MSLLLIAVKKFGNQHNLNRRKANWSSVRAFLTPPTVPSPINGEAKALWLGTNGILLQTKLVQGQTSYWRMRESFVKKTEHVMDKRWKDWVNLKACAFDYHSGIPIFKCVCAHMLHINAIATPRLWWTECGRFIIPLGSLRSGAELRPIYTEWVFCPSVPNITCIATL